MSQPSGRTIGLALSGGVARAAAHLGVLEVLEEAGIPVGAISGTSGGSLVGAIYASRKHRLEELIRHVLKLRWWKLLRPSFPIRGLIDGRPIARFVTEMIGPVEFSDLAIPLAIVACDLKTGEKVVLREGPVASAVQASCSLPFFFNPTVIEGRALVDGGYVSLIPIRTAREELPAGKVVGVDVNYRAFEGAPAPENIFRIPIHLAALWAQKNSLEEVRLADAMIRVDVRGFGLTELNRADELIQKGREAARAVLPELKRWLSV
jgi:NTE family protein